MAELSARAVEAESHDPRPRDARGRRDVQADQECSSSRAISWIDPQVQGKRSSARCANWAGMEQVEGMPC